MTGSNSTSTWLRVLLLLAAVTLVLPGAQRPAPPAPTVAAIGGPYGNLLAHSTDLGAARDGDVQVVVALAGTTRPAGLLAWADHRGLSARWRPGEDWAVISGGADKVAQAFEVNVHDYRTGDGHVFYAAATQPGIPRQLRGQVTDVGRILGYGRRGVVTRPTPPLDVPKPGMTPPVMMTAYNATPLATTGKGQTIAFFEFGDYDTSDLRAYAQRFNLADFNMAPPIGGMPPHNDATGETMMDLEAAHAVAPDAQLVVVNATSYFPDDNYRWSQVETMFDAADSRYPGAVWSSSITVGPCDQLLKALDANPARSALARAEAHGTSAFDAAGDTAGLECKQDIEGHWGAAPTGDDIGLDSMASLPEMTDVGGTTLSTDAKGQWVSEETWVDYAMQQGTGGGISAVFTRPAWQSGLSVQQDTQNPPHRLTPDVSAVADAVTGMLIRYDNKWVIMGGTSLAAPMWAGMAALMNEYLLSHGGRALGDINPLLYQAAESGARQPAFHDVTLGGNDVYTAASGYDLVTGLGTPNVDNLVHDILDIQRAGR